MNKIKIGFLTDAHTAERAIGARTSSYADDIFRKLEEVRERAASWDFGIFGGDWGHWPRVDRTNPALIYRSIDLLRAWPTPLFFVIGNHDMPPEMMAGLERSYVGAVLKGCEGTNVMLLERSLTLPRVSVNGDCIVPAAQLSPAHWHKDIDKPEGRGAYAVEERDPDADLVIKIAHGLIVPPTVAPPFEATRMDEVSTGGIDLFLFGHPHWTTPPQMVNGCLFVGPGAIARCSRDEMDRAPSVAEIDILTRYDKATAAEGVILHNLRCGDKQATVRYVPLTSARPAGDVFEAAAEPSRPDAGTFDGYLGMLEAYGGAALDPYDTLDVLAKNAPPEVLAFVREKLDEAGGRDA